MKPTSSLKRDRSKIYKETVSFLVSQSLLSPNNKLTNTVFLSCMEYYTGMLFLVSYLARFHRPSS
jgi:hypothetical protein